MCHIVDPLAKPPRRKYAWKVVVKGRNGSLKSVWGYHYTSSDTYWRVGRYTRAKNKTKADASGRSLGGIYVYNSKSIALREARYDDDGDAVVIKVMVRKEDWLNTSVSGLTSCYKKAMRVK